MRLPMLLLAALLGMGGLARAQEPAPSVPVQEDIQIGLSMDRVRITADFSGADITIFGSLDNPDPTVIRQGRYDVIVVLEGPARPVVVRRKSRVLGVWINTQSETFVNVPSSYSVATTRPPQDITTPESYRQLALGIDSLYVQPSEPGGDPKVISDFTAALRSLRLQSGVYSINTGGVQFLSQNLFRATLRLAPDIPLGTHRARAFLFRNGVFIKEAQEPLVIQKGGFEQAVFRIAHNDSLLYGLGAVALALITGWLGRIVFRRD